MLSYPSMGAARRSRERQRRKYQVTVRLSEAEQGTLTAAADRAGLALAAYLARAGMDVAEHRTGSITDLQRDALAELMVVGRLLRHIGTDPTRAVGRPNATGRPGADLGPAAAYCMQVARRADDAIVLLRKRLL
jgi:acyl CoA:acetate/3-ketoacid CoA transferase alpha subunit